MVIFLWKVKVHESISNAASAKCTMLMYFIMLVSDDNENDSLGNFWEKVRDDSIKIVNEMHAKCITFPFIKVIYR